MDKKVIKVVVLTDKPMKEVIKIMETNGCVVTAAEQFEPSWEDIWEGYEQ